MAGWDKWAFPGSTVKRQPEADAHGARPLFLCPPVFPRARGCRPGVGDELTGTPRSVALSEGRGLAGALCVAPPGLARTVSLALGLAHGECLA